MHLIHFVFYAITNQSHVRSSVSIATARIRRSSWSQLSVPGADSPILQDNYLLCGGQLLPWPFHCSTNSSLYISGNFFCWLLSEPAVSMITFSRLIEHCHQFFGPFHLFICVCDCTVYFSFRWMVFRPRYYGSRRLLQESQRGGQGAVGSPWIQWPPACRGRVGWPEQGGHPRSHRPGSEAHFPVNLSCSRFNGYDEELPKT